MKPYSNPHSLPKHQSDEIHKFLKERLQSYLASPVPPHPTPIFCFTGCSDVNSDSHGTCFPPLSTALRLPSYTFISGHLTRNRIDYGNIRSPILCWNHLSRIRIVSQAFPPSPPTYPGSGSFAN